MPNNEGSSEIPGDQPEEGIDGNGRKTLRKRKVLRKNGRHFNSNGRHFGKEDTLIVNTVIYWMAFLYKIINTVAQPDPVKSPSHQAKGVIAQFTSLLARSTAVA